MSEYIRVQGYITEVKFNKDELEIFLVLDVDGERKTVAIKSEQLIQFPTDRATKQDIMLKYYDAWKVRQDKGLPVNLELTEEQMAGGQDA